MQFDSDADVEATVTTLLRDRGARAVVEPDLSSVTAARPQGETDPGGPTRWWLAVAAVVIAAAGVGLVLRDGGTGPDRAAITSEPARSNAASAFDLIVWMEVGAEPAHVNDVAALLASSQSVEDVVYLDQAATWSEFVDFFADEPEIIELVDPEDLPTSFMVRATALDPVIELVASRPGVAEVEGVRADG